MHKNKVLCFDEPVWQCCVFLNFFFYGNNSHFVWIEFFRSGRAKITQNVIAIFWSEYVFHFEIPMYDWCLAMMEPRKKIDNIKALNSRYRTLFPYKPDPRPTFLRHTQRSRIQKLGLFWGPQKILRASEAGKKKWPKLHHFLGKK